MCVPIIQLVHLRNLCDDDDWRWWRWRLAWLERSWNPHVMRERRTFQSWRHDWLTDISFFQLLLISGLHRRLHSIIHYHYKSINRPRRITSLSWSRTIPGDTTRWSQPRWPLIRINRSWVHKTDVGHPTSFQRSALQRPWRLARSQPFYYFSRPQEELDCG